MLLIDEIDKSDQEFEAFLLEILSDYQVTIPEIGTVAAIVPPIVLLTSNSTRDLGDALKRRCLHLHIGFPDDRLEARIIASRVPGIDARLLKQLGQFRAAAAGAGPEEGAVGQRNDRLGEGACCCCTPRCWRSIWCATR